MEHSFWLEKWEKNEIAFHEKEANPVLVKYLAELSLKKANRIFLPLCGKTLDISWLLSQGYRVAGAELSSLAIEQLFAHLGVKPQVESLGKSKRYSAPDIDIYVGSIFDLTQEILGDVDAVYDRAALVALPQEMRLPYTAHLRKITSKAPQLLISYEYDQRLMDGPPFSVTHEEIERHYKAHYDLKLIAGGVMPGGLKGCAASEYVWLLKK